MRTTRGMRRRRALTVQAYGVVRDAWRPLVLRWRNAKARRTQAGARPSAAGARVTCVSHVHLHFAFAARAGRIGQARAGAARATVDVTTRRVAVEPIVKAQRKEPTAMKWRETERHAPARVAATVGQRRMPARTELRHVATRPPVMRSDTAAARHVGGVSLAWRGERVRVADGRAMTSVEQRALQRTPAGAARLHVVKASAPGAAAYRPNAEMVSMRTARPRPLDLAWRTQTRLHAGGESSERESSPSSLSSPRIHAERGALRATVQSSDSALVQVQPRALEYSQFAPALVDRLADDVLRRVERRVRIERERRGI